MAIKNNSDGKPYFSQRNNKIKPASSCNVTSIINALSSAGWPVQQMVPDNVQPEDSLMHFIMTDASCDRKWRSLDPEGKIPPNEWHAVLAYGANKWLAKLGYTDSPVQFRENVTAEEIKAAIQDGGAAVVSGCFPSVDGMLNHVVAIVGYSGDDFIIDDPWGDFRDKYVTVKGNDIPMKRAEFISFLKPLGNTKKWAHLVKQNPYVVKKESKTDILSV